MASSLNELRIVFVEKTGNGKSSTGNSLLNGRIGFKAMCSASSVTKDCTSQTISVTGSDSRQIKLILVDTPGFFDTNKANTNEMIKNTITKQIFELTSPGVHAFLFILSNNRFGPEEQETVGYIETIFGTGVTLYGIVVVTHLDELEDDERFQNLDVFIQQSAYGLQELIQKCGGRKFAINNKLKDHRIEQQIQPLIKMIENLVRMNNGKCYTHAEYQRIEKSQRLVCGGHRYPKCNKCRDWYYAGGQVDWNWILRNESWTNSDHNRWHGGIFDQYFRSRDDKTCTYTRVYEQGDSNNNGFHGHGTLLDFMNDLTIAFREQPQHSLRRQILHEDICEYPDNYKP